MKKSLGVAIAGLALVVTACGGLAGGGSNTTPAPETTADVPRSTTTTVGTTTLAVADEIPVISTGSLSIIVPPGEDGSLPPDLIVGCWAGPYFPFSTLEETTLLSEDEPPGVAEAIDGFLSSGEGDFWPQDGWLVLTVGDDELLLVNEGSDGLAFMNVSRADGVWAWAGSQMGGPCPLHYGVPNDLNPVDWRVDPDIEVDPDATELHVIATERPCVSGQEMGDRLLEPQVVMTPTELRIAFAAERPPGEAFTCPGNPETPVTVTLPEPLGDRAVVEGYVIGLDLEDFLP